MESVSTHSGHSTVTAQKGTRVSFVTTRHLVIQATTRRYSMKNTRAKALQIAVCAFSLLLIGLGILSEAVENFECAVSSRKVYSEAWYLYLHSR